MRKYAIAVSIAAFMGGAMLAGTASADVDVNWGVTISSGNPPPAVIYEPAPPPRASHVWVTGYWAWQRGNYVWVPGHWERARLGYVYAQPQWHEGPEGWRFRPGRWQRDGRHDGYPERHDDRDGYGDRHGNGDGNGHGCPPGHRRKGEC